VYYAWDLSVILCPRSPSSGPIGIDKGTRRNLLPMTLDAKIPDLDARFP
jgi:hypothetical protein